MIKFKYKIGDIFVIPFYTKNGGCIYEQGVIEQAGFSTGTIDDPVIERAIYTIKTENPFAAFFKTERKLMLERDLDNLQKLK